MQVYFAGSVPIENYLPIFGQKDVGVLFTFHDIPKKRMASIKKKKKKERKNGNNRK